MALHKSYLLLCKEWPIAKRKTGKDIGELLRRKVKEHFTTKYETDNVKLKACEERYKYLHLIATDHSRKKWPTGFTNMASGGKSLKQLQKLVEESLEVVTENNDAAKMTPVR